MLTMINRRYLLLIAGVLVAILTGFLTGLFGMTAA
jgi:hypothetical protein